MNITLAEAKKVIANATVKAKALNTKMSISVVDTSANLVTFERMDGAFLGPIDIASDNKEDICSANGVSVATTQAMVNAQQNIESTANQLQTHLNCMLKKDYHETAEIKQKKHVITQYLNRIRLEREVFQKNREILEKGRAQSAQDKIAYVSNYYWMIIWGLIILYIMYRIVK